MLKKTLFAALLALSFVAAESTQAGVPPPECNPSPVCQLSNSLSRIVLAFTSYHVQR